MRAIGEPEAVKACWTLFGGAADPAFLRGLTPPEVKRTFRQKALLLHPDRFTDSGPALRRRQTERFQAITAAYETLLDWFDRDEVGEEDPSPLPPPRRATAHRRAEGLGTYLRRRGAISYENLIAAIAWQQRGRPRVGELAIRWGWLTPAQVEQVLHTRGSPRFAERAVELGMLTPFRARTLLRFQRTQQRRLGDFFVEEGLIAREELERLAAAHLSRRTASRA